MIFTVAKISLVRRECNNIFSCDSRVFICFFGHVGTLAGAGADEVKTNLLSRSFLTTTVRAHVIPKKMCDHGCQSSTDLN